ncbi:MAG TPA: cytochrome c [Aliiroseovarius sp.]|nr:cytochrome c [Aliiroseovarius sp.]
MSIPKPLGAVLFLAACSPAAPDLTGAQLFQANCAGCHGTDARGGAAYGAPDLTTLAARNGGVFPAEYVMSTIDGLERENTHDKMPIFGEILQSDMEIWIDPNGTPTPTPGALIRLAEYLEGVQR